MWLQKTKSIFIPFIAVSTIVACEAQSDVAIYDLSDEKVLKLAEAGNGEAQFEWAERVAKSGATEDYENPEVKAWFVKSAENGYAEAYNMLAVYETNYSDEPDLEQARKYWVKAIELGSVTGKLNYATNLFSDDSYSKQSYQYMTELEGHPELEKHEELRSRRHYVLFNIYSFKHAGQDFQPEKAIEHGKKCAYGTKAVVHCQFLLARYLDKGWAGETNQTEAAKLFLTAAERGHSAAQWYTGMNFLNGTFEKNETEAYHWVIQSAEQGYLDGMISAAVMNATGEGTELNLNNAFGWYERAARQGSHHALRGLSSMYLNGEGRAANKRLATAGFIIASEEDDIAMQYLTSTFEDYEGIVEDLSKELAVELKQMRQDYGFE